MIGRIVTSRIEKIRIENKELKSFYLRPLEKINKPKPGQFLMVWVPGFEEIPLSVSGHYNDLIRVTVAKRGKTTIHMHHLKIGDLLGIKGPLGKPIPLHGNKRYLLIGGGYGIAPLIYFLHEYKSSSSKEINVIIGARSSDLLAFENEAKTLGAIVHIATEDGSKGFKGTAIDLMKQLIDSVKFDIVVLCGPKKMLIKGAEIAVNTGIQAYVVAEEYMKCGIGLCGSCELGNSGLLVCRDGPVFDSHLFLRSLGSS